MDSRGLFGVGKLLPLQGDRRATTVTQGDCPGLGGDALSGRIGEGGDALSGRIGEGGDALSGRIGEGGAALSGRIGEGWARLLPLMAISPWLMALLRRVWARLLPLMTISPWLLPCTAGESSGNLQTRRLFCAFLSRCRRMACSAPSVRC